MKTKSKCTEMPNETRSMPRGMPNTRQKQILEEGQSFNQTAKIPNETPAANETRNQMYRNANNYSLNSQQSNAPKYPPLEDRELTRNAPQNAKQMHQNDNPVTNLPKCQTKSKNQTKQGINQKQKTTPTCKMLTRVY